MDAEEEDEEEEALAGSGSATSVTVLLTTRRQRTKEGSSKLTSTKASCGVAPMGPGGQHVGASTRTRTTLREGTCVLSAAAFIPEFSLHCCGIAPPSSISSARDAVDRAPGMLRAPALATERREPSSAVTGSEYAALACLGTTAP